MGCWNVGVLNDGIILYSAFPILHYSNAPFPLTIEDEDDAERE